MLTADVERVESMIDDHSWVEYALCAEKEPDALFVQGAAQRQVRMRCNRECLLACGEDLRNANDA